MNAIKNDFHIIFMFVFYFKEKITQRITFLILKYFLWNYLDSGNFIKPHCKTDGIKLYIFEIFYYC